jgi:hypothetical protein
MRQIEDQRLDHQERLLREQSIVHQELVVGHPPVTTLGYHHSMSLDTLDLPLCPSLSGDQLLANIMNSSGSNVGPKGNQLQDDQHTAKGVGQVRGPETDIIVDLLGQMRQLKVKRIVLHEMAWLPSGFMFVSFGLLQEESLRLDEKERLLREKYDLEHDAAVAAIRAAASTTQHSSHARKRRRKPKTVRNGRSVSPSNASRREHSKSAHGAFFSKSSRFRLLNY